MAKNAQFFLDQIENHKVEVCNKQDFGVLFGKNRKTPTPPLQLGTGEDKPFLSSRPKTSFRLGLTSPNIFFLKMPTLLISLYSDCKKFQEFTHDGKYECLNFSVRV